MKTPKGLIILIPAGVGIISTFLPWLSANIGAGITFSGNGFGNSDGIIAFAGFCASAVLAAAIYYIQDISILKVLSWLIVACGVVSIFFCWKFTGTFLMTCGGNNTATQEIGLTLAFLSGIATAIAGYLLTRHFQ